MKKIITAAVLLVVLSIALLGCRSKQPCPVYKVHDSEVEEIELAAAK